MTRQQGHRHRQQLVWERLVRPERRRLDNLLLWTVVGHRVAQRRHQLLVIGHSEGSLLIGGGCGCSSSPWDGRGLGCGRDSNDNDGIIYGFFYYYYFYFDYGQFISIIINQCGRRRPHEQHRENQGGGSERPYSG